MEVTNPENTTQQNTEQEALEKSNVQKRIDELTAEKFAYAEQVKQLTATTTELTRKVMDMSSAPMRQQEVQQPALPEGIDPNLAKFFADQISSVKKAAQEQTEKMYWQVQHQLDQQNVKSRYANLPAEVLDDAAKRLTGLKQQYGPGASLDDAVKLAYADFSFRQLARGNQQSYNQMSQPMNMQTAMPNVGGGAQQQLTNLVPPTQDANWDRMSLQEQNKRIDEYEKKGGRLL